jgi:hypothetical protein
LLNVGITIEANTKFGIKQVMKVAASFTCLQESQQLGGWASFEMVLRYAHLSSDHLKEASERICHKNVTVGSVGGQKC